MSQRPLANAVGQNLAVDTQYNWAAMFTAFASGSSLEEISATFACPMPVLRRAATAQDWAAIATRLVTPPAAQPKPETETRLAVLEANRRKNYEMADMLRDRLMHDFAQLKHGTLKVEKALMHKGEVIHTEVDPGPQDMVAMANAAKAVADMTYRALGDVQAGEERNGPRQGEAAAITVILPTVVHNHGPAAPAIDVTQGAEVVDLRPRRGVSIDEVVEKKAAQKALTQSALDDPDPTDVDA
jgi:hypothetical protein